MVRLALRQLWARRLQALAPLLALLVATIGFQSVVLSARVSQSHIQGVIAASERPPYDLLVRPAATVAGLTRGDRNVQPNYLETAPGGISMQQVSSVRAIPGVQVAAPLAVVAVDYLQGQDYAVDLTTLPHTGDLTIYRISTSFSTDGGASTIHNEAFALVAGSQPPFFMDVYGPARAPMKIDESHVVDCPDWCFGPDSIFPKQADNRTSIVAPRPEWAANRVPYETYLTAPIVAVDPVSEEALYGVSRCLTGGRALTPADPANIQVQSPGNPRAGDQDHPSQIPVLLNARPGFDDRIQVTVDVSNAALPELRPALSDLLLEGGTVHRYLNLPTLLLEKLTYHRVTQTQTDLNAVWNSASGVGFLDGSISHRAVDGARVTVPPLSFVGAVPHLAAQPVAESVLTDQGPNTFALGSMDESQDTPFHTLHQLAPPSGTFAAKSPWHAFGVVGKYDPTCLSRHAGLGKSAYDIYANADTTTPSGPRWGPNASITNFTAVMPLVMTNLAGGAFFSDPRRFEGGKGDSFLSVIRVKVSHPEAIGPASQLRLERVAAEIHKRTGLTVDIVAGSSTQTVSIDVPKGAFGRPAMTVTQDWLARNVAIGFVNAVNRTAVALSLVVAVVAGLLTMQATYATVRRRKGELVLLRAIGWPSWRIAALMELEVVALGSVVALVALGVAALMAVLGRPGGPVVVGLVLAAPAAIAITALAGAGPALTASRTRPLAALRGPGRIRRRRRLLARPFGLGVREALTTWRWQTLLGALATAVGAMFLGAVLSISQGFHASLDSTALAHELANEVGPFDILLGVLAVVLGAGTAVSVVLVATRERLPHFATLRALGWSQRQVAGVVSAQAMTVGLLGGILGAAALALIGSRVPGGIPITPLNLLSPLALGVVTGLFAAFAGFRLVYARVAVSVLRVG